MNPNSAPETINQSEFSYYKSTRLRIQNCVLRQHRVPKVVVHRLEEVFVVGPTESILQVAQRNIL